MYSHDYYGNKNYEEYQNYPRQNFGKCYYQKYEGDVPPVRKKNKKKKRKYSTRRKAMIFGSNISDRIRTKFWGNSKSGRETIILNEELEPLKPRSQKSENKKKKSKKKSKWRKKIKKFCNFILGISFFMVIFYYIWKLKAELASTRLKLKLEEMEENITNPNPVDQGVYSETIKKSAMNNSTLKMRPYKNDYEKIAYQAIGAVFKAVPEKAFKDNGLPTDTESQIQLLRDKRDKVLKARTQN